MANRSLVIDDDARDLIHALRIRACRGAPLNMAKITRQVQTRAGRWRHQLAMEPHILDLGSGYLLTYTIEDFSGRVLRHLSITVDAAEKLPGPALVQQLLVEFGFVGRLEHDTHAWKEANGLAYYAINIVQAIDHIAGNAVSGLPQAAHA